MKSTERVELVETHALALSLKRLRESGSHDDQRWRRALYHALAMNYVCHSQLKAIREALGLP